MAPQSRLDWPSEAQIQEYGYVPPALPNARCYGAEKNLKDMPDGRSFPTRPPPPVSTAATELKTTVEGTVRYLLKRAPGIGPIDGGGQATPLPGGEQVSIHPGALQVRCQY